MNNTFVKLKFNPLDYQYVVDRIYNKETGKVNLDTILNVPESFKVPMSYDMLKGPNGEDVIRFSEYAAIHYLKSLGFRERKIKKEQMVSIRNFSCGNHPYASNSVNVPFSMVWDWCNNNSVVVDLISDKEALDIFNKLYSENKEVMDKYGITSIDDLGKIVYENLFNYQCDDIRDWKYRHCGFGYCADFRVDSDNYGNPSVEMAVNGVDTIYFDTRDIKVTDFLVNMFDELYGEKKPHVDISMLEGRINTCDPYYTCRSGFIYSDIGKIKKLRAEFDKAFHRNLKVRCNITVPKEDYEKVRDGIINEKGKIDLRRVYPMPDFDYGVIPNVSVPKEFSGDWYQLAAIAYLKEKYDVYKINGLEYGSSSAKKLVSLYWSFDDKILEKAKQFYNYWLETTDMSENPMSLTDFGRRVVDNLLTYGDYKEAGFQNSNYGYIGEEIEQSFASDECEIQTRTIYPEIDLGYGYVPSSGYPNSATNWYEYAALLYLDSAENKNELLEMLNSKSGYTKALKKLYEANAEKIVEDKENAVEAWKAEQEKYPEMLDIEELGRMAVNNLLMFDTYKLEDIDSFVYGRDLKDETIKYNSGFYGEFNGSPYLLGLAISKAYPEVVVSMTYDFNDSNQSGQKLEFLNGELVMKKDGYGFDFGVDELARKYYLEDSETKQNQLSALENVTGNKVYMKQD